MDIAAKFYSAGGMGIIYALDEQTGAVKWSFNTVKDGDLWGHPDVNSGGGSLVPAGSRYSERDNVLGDWQSSAFSRHS